MVYVLKALKAVTFFLDKIVYLLASISFKVFCYLSKITLVDGGTIEKLANRIYIVIGIVMFFVLAYNLLNYIVDPDKISDKNVGASAFIKNIVIALVIITITPTVFTKLYAFQNTIITSGVISHLILGGNYSSGDNPGQETVERGINETIANTYSAFIMPKAKNEEGNYYTAMDCNNESALNDKTMSSYCSAYAHARQTGNISEFENLISDDSNYDYWPIVSTVAGLVLTFFMLSFCLNLGIRAGKMALLALIAPVPAMLELVPGKQGLRKKWLESLISTYLEVFIFQAVVFLIIYLMTLIPNVVIQLFSSVSSTESGGILIKAFALVFLYFGLLQFAKEAPKMITDLLGIKSSGTIGAAFKRGVNMAGATAAGAGVAFLGGRQGVAQALKYGKDAVTNGDWKAGLKSAQSLTFGTFRGLAGGLGSGMWANRKGGLRGISSGISSGSAINSAFQRRVDNFQSGIPTGVRNAYQGFQDFRHDPRGSIGDALQNRRERFWRGVDNYAEGSGYAELTERIKAMSGAKDFFKNVTKGDVAYENAERMLNEAKAKTSFTTDYAAWKSQMVGKGNKEKDLGENKYIEWLKTSPHSSAYSSVINAYDRQESLKKAKIEKKQVDIINNALGMMQYIDLHPQINLSGTASDNLSTLRGMLDNEGNLREKLDASGNAIGTYSIEDVYKALDDLSSQLDKDIKIDERTIQRRKLEEEARNRNSSGGNK